MVPCANVVHYVPKAAGKHARVKGTFRENLFRKYLYSRTPETETAHLSQSYASLNFSQFQADCRINSNTAILNYVKLFVVAVLEFL